MESIDREQAMAKYISLPGTSSPETLDRWLEGAASFEAVAAAIKKQGYSAISGREILSSGFNGPIFVIQTDKGPVVEKTYIRGGVHENQTMLGKRFTREGLVPSNAESPRARLRVVGDDPNQAYDVVDWVYNEELALKALKDTPGIPHFIAAVYEGSKGSIVEEYIDGDDLWAYLHSNNDPAERARICQRMKDCFLAAARRGCLLNNPSGGSILIDRASKQPYFLDWYDHRNIEPNTPEFEAQTKKGLEEIEKINNITSDF